MRIDKFLWSVRFFKTRSIAAEEIKKNRVSVSGQPVKASREVKIGDRIQVRKNQIDYQMEVKDLPKSRVSAKLVQLYVHDKTPQEQYDLLEMRRMEQSYYRQKGEGRPTKKDRREIQEYTGFDGGENDQSTKDSHNDTEEYWRSFFNEDEGEDS